MITCNIDNLGSMFAHAQYTAYYITVALTPTPLVLLYLPTIDDVANQEQILTAMMLEEVVEFLEARKANKPAFAETNERKVTVIRSPGKTEREREKKINARKDEAPVAKKK